MKRIELLAPAGNFDCLKAAVNNGANAVYLGGKNFSARAFAGNFDYASIDEAIEYAHLRNVKVYVTINTLLTEKELNNAIKDVDYYYKHHVDAFLIQDLGLYYYIKNNYPDMELHCSTQMHVHNISGVRNAKKLGFSRVVVARESTLDFIKEACKEDIEIETFVHGAICVSYSGQCLMSSSTKNRSANKGMCAQCCRLSYSLFDDNGKKVVTDTDYLLSPKDMCLINDVPKLIEAGVSSLKIEGRMKSSAYVGYVTSLYRKAIDSYYDHKEFVLSDEELTNLKVLFNRNFTDDYLYDKADIFGQMTSNHLGIVIGKTINYHNNRLYIKLAKELNQFDGIRIGDFGCIVNRLYKDDLLVNSAKAGDIVNIEAKNINDIVYKTVDYKLENSINSITDKHIPLDIYIKIEPNKKIIVKALNFDGFQYESETIPELSINSPLTEDKVLKQFNKLVDTPYFLNRFDCDTSNAFLPVSKLNDVRRSFISKLNEYRLNSHHRTIVPCEIDYKDLFVDDSSDSMVEDKGFIYCNDVTYPINYVINRNSRYVNDDYAVISEFGGLLLDYQDKIAYYTLNCTNSYTYEFLNRLGFKKIVLSSELNSNQINDLIEGYNSRNKLKIKPYVFKDGQRALMYIKNNPLTKYNANDKYTLKADNHIFKLNSMAEALEIVEDYHQDISEQVLSFVKKEVK